MAAKFAEADLEDITQCHICFLQFSDERIPKILNCTHTVCLPCLKSIGRGELRLKCPECRATIDVSQGDPTKLITNRGVLNMAKLQQITKCETCGRECINNKCFHCGKSICADCVKEHEKAVETEMNKLRSNLQGSLSDIKKFQSTVDDHMETLNKDTENNVQQIEKDYRLLEKALKDRKGQLIEQVKINSRRIHTSHDTVQGIVVTNVTDIETSITDIDGVSDSISSLTKQTIDSIINNGEEAINQMNQTFPNCDIKFTAISCDSMVDGLLRAIQNWGNVTPQEGVNVKLTGSPTEHTDGKKQQSPPRPQTCGKFPDRSAQKDLVSTSLIERGWKWFKKQGGEVTTSSGLDDQLQPKLIALGGMQYKQQGEKEQVTVADCSVLKDNTWQTVAQLPVPNWCNYGSCVSGGDIMVTGGVKWDETTGTNGWPISQCWRLQTCIMKWKQLPNLHHKRHFHGCVASDTSLYVVGGWGGGQPVAPVECLVAGGQHWEARAAMPTPVRQAGTTAYNSDIYSFGGKNSANKATNITQIYSTRTDTWRTAAPLPKASMVVAAVRHNNTIYVFDYWSTSYSCYSYNTASDVFTTLVSSATRHLHALPVMWQGKVLFMSGGAGGSRTVTAVEEYDPATNSWASSTVPLLRELTCHSMHCMLK